MARLSDRNNNITFVPQPQSPDVAGFVKETSDDVVPDGWLECNGQSVSTTAYPELFEKIGYTYGGSGGSFNLPGGSLLNNPTINGISSTTAPHLGGGGLLPAGAIVAYNPGYYTDASNGSFTVAGPAGNTVADINSYLNGQGWYVCDGAAVNEAASPIWNAASRHLPNLSDDRFLRGATAAGTTGGSNTTNIDHDHQVTSNVTVNSHTLTTAQIPSHTHSINHDHGAANTGNQSANHTHNHLNAGSGYNGPDVNALAFRSVNIIGSNVTSSTNSVSHTHSFNMPSFSGTSGSAGSDGGHSHGATNNTVTSAGASVTSVSIVPTYLSTFYIVRVF